MLVRTQLFFIGYKLAMIYICKQWAVYIIDVEQRHRSIMVPLWAAPARDVRRPRRAAYSPAPKRGYDGKAGDTGGG